jgi:hypothetical protein
LTRDRVRGLGREVESVEVGHVRQWAVFSRRSSCLRAVSRSIRNAKVSRNVISPPSLWVERRSAKAIRSYSSPRRRWSRPLANPHADGRLEERLSLCAKRSCYPTKSHLRPRRSAWSEYGRRGRRRRGGGEEVAARQGQPLGARAASRGIRPHGSSSEFETVGSGSWPARQCSSGQEQSETTWRKPIRREDRTPAKRKAPTGRSSGS